MLRTEYSRQLVVGLHAVLQWDHNCFWPNCVTNLKRRFCHLPGFRGDKDSVHMSHARGIHGSLNFRQREVSQRTLHAQAALAKRLEHRATSDEDDVIPSLR